MPGPVRVSVADGCYHVLNRGNGRADVFHKPEDYVAFLRLIAEACERLPMRVLAYCLMPNHFHLALQPLGDGDLSRWMQWLTTSHVRRYHRHYHTSGHVWQDRYKSFPIEGDEHLYIVLRYIERNPLRANLVPRAQEWEWSSVRWWRRRDRPSFLDHGPLIRPVDWVRRVNRPETEAELDALRVSVTRSAPFGRQAWQARTAAQLGLEATLRPRGRPRNKAKK
ncbi:MAG: transposase [Planctomycetes bacterium]|nr:transposase [Planctomycetota bacterium]